MRLEAQLCAFGSQLAGMLNKEKGWIGNVSGGTWNVSAVQGRLNVVQIWALAGGLRLALVLARLYKDLVSCWQASASQQAAEIDIVLQGRYCRLHRFTAVLRGATLPAASPQPSPTWLSLNRAPPKVSFNCPAPPDSMRSMPFPARLSWHR
jgi:hypothetical protein